MRRNFCAINPILWARRCANHCESGIDALHAAMKARDHARTRRKRRRSTPNCTTHPGDVGIALAGERRSDSGRDRRGGRNPFLFSAAVQNSRPVRCSRPSTELSVTPALSLRQTSCNRWLSSSFLAATTSMSFRRRTTRRADPAEEVRSSSSPFSRHLPPTEFPCLCFAGYLASRISEFLPGPGDNSEARLSRAARSTPGDQVFVDKFSYNFVQPHRGDVFVFRTDTSSAFREIPETGRAFLHQAAGWFTRRQAADRFAASLRQRRSRRIAVSRE